MNKKLQTSSLQGSIKQKNLTGNRRQRRAMLRKMDVYYALHCYEVSVFDDDEKFWVIAINPGHVQELLRQCPEEIKPEDINHIEALNPEQIKLITIQSDEDSEMEEANLYDVFQSYTGPGEIICSTMWVE